MQCRRQGRRRFRCPSVRRLVPTRTTPERADNDISSATFTDSANSGMFSAVFTVSANRGMSSSVFTVSASTHANRWVGEGPPPISGTPA